MSDPLLYSCLAVLMPSYRNPAGSCQSYISVLQPMAAAGDPIILRVPGTWGGLELHQVPHMVCECRGCCSCTPSTSSTEI